MKNLIITLLLTSLASYSQTVNLDLQIKNIIPVDLNNYKTEATALTIPSGKIWIIQSNPGPIGCFCKPNSFSVSKNFLVGNSSIDYHSIFLTGGTKVWCTGGDTTYLTNIIEFVAPSTFTGTLALNEIK